MLTSAGRAAAPARPARWLAGVVVCGSGGLADRDGVSEGFELADVVADLAFGADAVVVEVWPEVVVAGGVVGEQVEDDDQDGAGDRGQGLALAAAGQAAVALAEEGVGSGGGGGDLAEDAVEPGVALAGFAGGGFLPGLARL